MPARFRVACRVMGAVLACIAPHVASAGPLPEHWVAEGSDWVVHVDAERLAQAEALTPLFDAMTASAWGASLGDMGIDARMDVSGITMFGTITRGPEARGETTTMLQGGAALREAIQKHVEAHDGYTLVLRRALQADGKGISAWTIDSLAVHVALVPMTPLSPADSGINASPRLVAVLSDNSDRLQSCIGLLLRDRQGRAPDAGDGDASTPGCPPGCVIYARAKDLDDAHPRLRSELLASADSMVAHLGYRQVQGTTVVFAGLKVQGNDEADGEKMVSALNVMIDFWIRRTTELAARNPDLMELLPLVQACQVSLEGSMVELTMERAIVRTEDSPAKRPEQPPGASDSGKLPSSEDR